MMFGRVMSYMAYLQFPMIVYLFVVQSNLNLIMTLAAIAAGCILLALVDWAYIFPREKMYDSTINPQWNELMRRVKRIELRLSDESQEKI